MTKCGSLCCRVASDDGLTFLKGEVLVQVLACGLQGPLCGRAAFHGSRLLLCAHVCDPRRRPAALASDNRVQVRQLGAALLHNAALQLPTDADGAVSDDLVQVLCALSDGVNTESDGETLRRRLLGVGLIVKRVGGPAAELMEALE